MLSIAIFLKKKGYEVDLADTSYRGAELLLHKDYSLISLEKDTPYLKDGQKSGSDKHYLAKFVKDNQPKAIIISHSSSRDVTDEILFDVVANGDNMVSYEKAFEEAMLNGDKTWKRKSKDCTDG